MIGFIDLESLFVVVALYYSLLLAKERAVMRDRA
jgi:hypothetical protein